MATIAKNFVAPFDVTSRVVTALKDMVKGFQWARRMEIQIDDYIQTGQTLDYDAVRKIQAKVDASLNAPH